MLNTLENLFNLARDRKKNPVEGSYTNRLLHDKNLSRDKILEEINELVEAVGKNPKIPNGSREWNCTGKTIYAGFIDPYLLSGTENPKFLDLNHDEFLLLNHLLPLTNPCEQCSLRS